MNQISNILLTNLYALIIKKQIYKYHKPSILVQSITAKQANTI